MKADLMGTIIGIEWNSHNYAIEDEADDAN